MHDCYVGLTYLTQTHCLKQGEERVDEIMLDMLGGLHVSLQIMGWLKTHQRYMQASYHSLG